MTENEKSFQELMEAVLPLDHMAMEAAKKRQASLAKPPGSLGRLEELSIQLAGITGNVNNHIKGKYLLIFAADNGVVVEGVACAPQSVTKMQTINLTRNKTGGSVLAAAFGCQVRVVDVGVAAELHCPEVINEKIAYGTKNIRHAAAMTRDEALTALLTGAKTARKVKEEGADVIGIGEMGIGNTTTAAALLGVLCDEPAEKITGRGGGTTDEMFAKKKSVIADAISRARGESGEGLENPLTLLCELGGYDIAAMTGAYIGGAALNMPVVIDGVISAAAALLACRFCPNVRQYMVASHKSTEYAYAAAMEHLGLSPLFDLNMRLGEGSGCPLAFSVLEAACAVINHMATFEEAEIDDGYLCEVRKTEGCFGTSHISR